MGRRVKRVLEAEKSREKERVEKWGLAMATWREEGREWGARRSKRVRETREARGAESSNGQKLVISKGSRGARKTVHWVKLLHTNLKS